MTGVGVSRGLAQAIQWWAHHFLAACNPIQDVLFRPRFISSMRPPLCAKLRLALAVYQLIKKYVSFMHVHAFMHSSWGVVGRGDARCDLNLTNQKIRI